MASYVRCLCVLFLVFLSLSLQIHARDSKFFNKFSPKKSKDNLETISISPTSSTVLAPSPESESEVVEHGYGLYGSESYQYTPTTTDPVKSTSLVGEEKYVPVEELKEKRNFMDLETRYSNNGNMYGNKKQGMSDTRFLENGKYYHDVNNEQGEFENNYNDNEEYVSNNGNEHKNGYHNGDDELETEEEEEGEEGEEYNYKSHEYETHERVKSKTLPSNEYDSMEEYEKEQEYKQSEKEYVP